MQNLAGIGKIISFNNRKTLYPGYQLPSAMKVERYRYISVWYSEHIAFKCYHGHRFIMVANIVFEVSSADYYAKAILGVGMSSC